MTEGSTPGARRIAHALAEAVARRGRSTEQLAAAIGLPPDALADRLRGDAPFGLDEIERLAAELDLSVTAILTTRRPGEGRSAPPAEG